MNEKWFALPISEIENKLKTNAAAGLSRKAARCRLSAKYGTVFSVPVRSPLSYLGELVGDFAYIILMIMSVLALCFGENDTGIVATVCIIINLSAAFIMYYRSQFFSDSLERLFLPRCRVIRDGKLYSVDGTSVVRGDIIMLEAGDIVPADARLITSEKLKVKMLFEREKFILLDKAAESRVSGNEKDPMNFGNIVHAASVVVSGSARAVVTEVGQYTYVGAKIGTIPSVSKGRDKIPGVLSLLKKYCVKFSFILMATVLPFSILSMLFGNATLSLFSSFMTAISIAASCMSQFSVTVCKAFYTTSMRRCISSESPALIRSADAMDKLASAKYLFVLDGAMLSDGALHFERLLCADGEFLPNTELRSETVKRLGELSSLYDGVQKSSLSVSSHTFYRYEGAIKEFVQYAAADRGAINIRCNITGFAAASYDLSDPHDRLFYTEFGEKYMLCVSYTDSIINECAECLVGGKRAPLSFEAREDFMNRYRSYKRDGKRVLVLSFCRYDGYSEMGKKCFGGMLVLSEKVDDSASQTLSSIQGMGVKPIFFRNISVGGKDVDVTAIPLEITPHCVSVGDFTTNGRQISYGLGKISCYNFLSDIQICELIDALHSTGERVAVIGFCADYERIYQKADLVLSCSSDKYKLKGKFEEEIELLQAADDLSKVQAAETLRRRADIIIPRPDKKRTGGCLSLLEALKHSFAATENAVRFFRYVICMQIVRMVLVMVPMLFGGSALDARHIVLGGLVADFMVMFSFIADKKFRTCSRVYRSAMKELSSPLYSNAWSVICFAGGALFASVLPEILSLLPSVPKYIDKTEYSFIVFVLFHLITFCCFRFDLSYQNLVINSKTDRKKPSINTFIYPVIIIVFVVLCFIVPRFSSLFDIEGFSNVLYLFISLVPPIISAVLYFFFGKREFSLKNKRI